MTREQAIEIDFQISIHSPYWADDSIKTVRAGSEILIDSLIALGILKVDSVESSKP